MTLSIDDLLDPSIGMDDVDDLEEEHDEYESRDDKYDHESKQLIDTEKYMAFPLGLRILMRPK